LNNFNLINYLFSFLREVLENNKTVDIDLLSNIFSIHLIRKKNEIFDKIPSNEVRSRFDFIKNCLIYYLEK
jgi:ABC-type bacteriocin/lantibiotic exporter with double-glycine peptidase domain